MPQTNYNPQTDKIQPLNNGGDPNQKITPDTRLTAKEWAAKYPALAAAFGEVWKSEINAQEPPPDPPPDPWQVFTLADAYQDRPPVEYIAAGLFALPSLNIVYGAPGTLKSFVLADLVACAAAGLGWLPPAPWVNGNRAKEIATRQAPVMWLDFDNGRRRTHDRFGALGRARALPDDAPLYYYSMPAPWLSATNTGSIAGLTQRIIDRGAKLVIIDNLGVVSGDSEENSASMALVMSAFRQIAEDTESAIVLIHHQRKSNGQALGRAGDALRGHSSIEASLDLALLIEREDYSDTLTLRATKVRGVDVLPFSAAFTYQNDESGELREARFFGIATLDIKSNNAIETEVLDALRAGGTMNKTALVEAVREGLTEAAQGTSDKPAGVNRIRDIIDRMAAARKIHEATGNGPTEKIYSLPSAKKVGLGL